MFRKGLWMTTAVLATLAVASVPLCGQDKPGDDAKESAATGGTPVARIGDLAALWKEFRRLEVNTPEYARALKELGAGAAAIPRAERMKAAAALMVRGAPDSLNASALELFGPDPVPISDIRRVLFNEKRSFTERIVVRTCYGFCRADYRSGLLNEQSRSALVGVLGERLTDVAGKKVGYGEQRLLSHLCQSVLSRYAEGEPEAAEVRNFLKGVALYGGAAPESDGLGASIRRWMVLRRMPTTAFGQLEGALAALGHWEPLVRWKASAMLGPLADSDPSVAQKLMEAMDDPQDEVRAGAARAFGFSRKAGGDAVIKRMYGLLVTDRGVIVQVAAAETLIARAEGSAGMIDSLLDALETGRPGSKRASAMLLVLARLAPKASASRKGRIVELAVARLSSSPEGALEALRTLGPEAKSALPNIRAYRETADRYRRDYIDSHVLPAIAPPQREQ